MLHFPLYCIFVCFCYISNSEAQWGFTQEQSDVYDIVDEAKRNFYEFFGVAQDASSAEIRRSYRKLSLTMHPDKNKTEGAEENFRILAAMYEVLKNKEKREIYDDVLANGLPAAYLYVPKRLRKMSFLEASIIISFIATIGHMLFMLGTYFEKRLEVDEKIEKRTKKQKKRGIEDLSSSQEAEEAVSFFWPTVYDVLPILLVRKLYAFVFWVPEYIKFQKEQQRLQREQDEKEKREEDEREQKYKEEINRRNELKKLKQERNRIKREEMLEAKKKTAEEGPLPPSVFEESQSIEDLEAMYDEMTENDFKKKTKTTTEWSEEDQVQLVKLISKYPGGTPERWAKIAKELGRSMNEVTSKAKVARSDVGNKSKYSAVTPSNDKLFKKNRNADSKKIPDEIISTKHPTDDEYCERKQTNDDADNIPSRIQRKQEAREMKLALQTNPDKRDDVDILEHDKWEQSQQKLLEMALTQFPKSSAERWEKIAKCVPGKTKEECIARYRFLSEKIQQRKKHRT